MYKVIIKHEDGTVGEPVCDYIDPNGYDTDTKARKAANKLIKDDRYSFNNVTVKVIKS